MKKINWGVLGTAGIAKGQTIPGMLKAEHCSLYAIAGRSLEKAKAYQAEFGFEVACDSYEALLADENIQAVYIPLPNQLHYEWVKKALQAKKHVLCEKPLVPTSRQVTELFAAARENGVLLMEAYAYLHSPLTAAIKAEVESGVLGEIRYAESSFITSDYVPTNIRMQKDTFGGSTYDLGCYCTTQLLWILGKSPEKVQAIADFSPAKVDRYTTAILNFPGGTTACIQCGMVLETEADRRIDRLQLHGTKGNLVCNAAFNQMGELRYTVTTHDGAVTKTVSAPHNYALEVEHLSCCILDGAAPRVTEQFSYENAKVLEAIVQEIGY